jgi:omega-hydroxy-beta-dihydromenaquinone-9 sulfotransferase
MGSTHNRYPWWACRVWNGMDVATLFTLLAKNRFAVSPSVGRIHIVVSAVIFSFMNSLLNAVQRVVYGRSIARVTLEPPIFIIGHWRSGTTFLHELLTCDPALTAPTTYECICPGHFHLSAWLFASFDYLIPSTRPMDDMKLSWHTPQEDEFALLNMGLPSPYEELAFPNHRKRAAPFLRLDEFSPRQRARWRETLIMFLKSVTLHRLKRSNGTAPRLVLKSPPHTARLAVLSEMFPNAKFIHIVRNPAEVFPSSVRTWASLFEVQGCQTPRAEALPNGAASIEDYVLSTFNELYRDFSQARDALPPDQFCELRYEDLIANPLAQLQRVYDHLQLGPFEEARPHLAAHLAEVRNYQPSRQHVAPDLHGELRRRWAPFFETYGY